MLKALFSRRPALDVQQTLQQAIAMQEQGRPGDAEALCRRIVKGHPDQFDAWQLLGTIALAQGKFGEAGQLFADALRCKPDAPDALTGRGSALLALDRPLEALASFEQALAISADFVPALCRRADVLQSLLRHQEAMAGYAQALAVAPEHFDALAGLGHAWDAQGNVAEALASCDRALAVQPDNAAMRNDRASLLFRLGRSAEAMIEWDRALAREPTLAAALLGRGNVLHEMGRSEEALAEYDKAIELAPDFAAAPYNRAVVLNSLGRQAEAIAAYSWAIAIKPDFNDALFNCGNLLSDQFSHDQALARFEQILVTEPDYPHAAGNVAFERAQMSLWEDHDRVVARAVDGVAAGKPVVAPLAFLALSHRAEAQRACATMLIAQHHPASGNPLWTGERYRHDRIRVAYLSADFQEHALAYLIAGMLEQHDHARFEITGIAFGPDIRCPMRTRLEATFDRLLDVRRNSDAEVAGMMRDLEIDIAVDLMGLTRHLRTGILACRPAPVQVNYLGYPGTMGADYIDYILADRFVIPEELRRHYAENVVYLPDTFQANDAKRPVLERTPSRAEVGLPPDALVFCSFNNNYKITPEMFSIWMRLLQQVPASVLWLVEGNALVQANLQREAQKRGVAPARLVFARRVPYPEYLARFRLADLFLDTLPFNGGTTASDALWAGLPVLTCTGEAFAARMAGSLLHAIGLPELITHSLAEYESLGLQLATDVPRLAAIRQKLARNRDSHPLFDTDRFRRNVEAAYVTMWEKTQRGEPPAGFAVPG